MKRGRPNGGRAGRQTEAIQDLADGLRGLDRAEDAHGAAALRTFQDIDFKDPAHPLGPMYLMV